MQAQFALDHLRNSLCSRFDLTALDQPLRSKAQYFRTSTGRVFGVLVGDLVAGRFDRKTMELILEPLSLPDGLAMHCKIVAQPYRGSSTEQPTKGVALKHAQIRLRFDSLTGLEALVAWYAGAARAV